ncbi:hypothetical protein AB4Y44_14000 [Paraburkholderia sp. BR10937]|uniref:hypothetical protein n=1 Tax=Paraburkholderia sp. BR10937 TaxID=3236994 RepID=UPI0034D1E2AA
MNSDLKKAVRRSTATLQGGHAQERATFKGLFNERRLHVMQSQNCFTEIGGSHREERKHGER